MKVLEIFRLIEGYKEATADFSKEIDKTKVTSVIDQYKELVKRNQVLGDERNIDYWRKQGWSKFNKFVETKSAKSSVTQIKRKKVAGNSITLQEDGEWLIVIPLDKEASCFHGKNSDWCTTKVNQSYFEQYFHKRDVVLIYCINKKNAGMWAIAAHSKIDIIELFDQRDNSITSAQFKEQTGLNPAVLASGALSAEHKPTIDDVKAEHKEMLNQVGDLITKLKSPGRVDKIEELLLKLFDGKQASDYISIAGPAADFPPNIQLAAVRYDGTSIEKIIDPAEQVQMAAVESDCDAFQFIEHPTKVVQLTAVRADGALIKHIKNPDIEVQLTAVYSDGASIRYIDNPSEKVQLQAIEHDISVLKYIKNQTDAVQLGALADFSFTYYPGLVSYFKNPSEKVKAAIKKWKAE